MTVKAALSKSMNSSTATSDVFMMMTSSGRDKTPENIRAIEPQHHKELNFEKFRKICAEVNWNLPSSISGACAEKVKRSFCKKIKPQSRNLDSGKVKRTCSERIETLVHMYPVLPILFDKDISCLDFLLGSAPDGIILLSLPFWGPQTLNKCQQHLLVVVGVVVVGSGVVDVVPGSVGRTTSARGKSLTNWGHNCVEFRWIQFQQERIPLFGVFQKKIDTGGPFNAQRDFQNMETMTCTPTSLCVPTIQVPQDPLSRRRWIRRESHREDRVVLSHVPQQELVPSDLAAQPDAHRLLRPHHPELPRLVATHDALGEDERYVRSTRVFSDRGLSVVPASCAGMVSFVLFGSLTSQGTKHPPPTFVHIPWFGLPVLVLTSRNSTTIRCWHFDRIPQACPENFGGNPVRIFTAEVAPHPFSGHPVRGEPNGEDGVKLGIRPGRQLHLPDLRAFSERQGPVHPADPKRRRFVAAERVPSVEGVHRLAVVGFPDGSLVGHFLANNKIVGHVPARCDVSTICRDIPAHSLVLTSLHSEIGARRHVLASSVRGVAISACHVL